MGGKNLSDEIKDVHVLFLSKEASYQNIGMDENGTLVMGFFDTINEVFQENYKGEQQVDYLAAFGIHTSSKFPEKHLTAKQLFTLKEYKDPLKCHYRYDSEEKKYVGRRNKEPEGFNKWILPSKRYQNLPVDGNFQYPAFLGVISVSLNLFQEKEYEEIISTIKDRLEKFIRSVRSNKEEVKSAGSISKGAEVRLFQCVNCSDLCITVNTNRLMDILLVSKAVQICTGEHAKTQFSPVWSFAAICKEAFTLPLEEDKDKLDPYVNHIVDMNSNRKEPNIKDSKPRKFKEAITVDFRISFSSFEAEKKFLTYVPDAVKFDKQIASMGRKKKISDKEISKLSVDNVYRVAGVLGNGSYSIHLPFHEYLELFRWKYLGKNYITHYGESAPDGKDSSIKDNHTNSDDSTKSGKVLDFLLQEIDKGNKTFEISYQRIRFCYPTHIFEYDKEKTTPFWKAYTLFSDPEKPIKCAKSQDKIHKYRQELEEVILNKRESLAKYRNFITSNEYRYREAVYLTKDLVFTYSDLLARSNIHTTIFITQILALLEAAEKCGDIFSGNEYPKEKARNLIIETTENLRAGCLALECYSHEVVANSGINFNRQNYEIQSKVNIEKYVVAYSYFLQTLCDAYRKKYPESVKYYPFVFLDFNEKKIHSYILFENLGDELSWTEKGNTPLLFAVGFPNYRRFANIYRLLPQLVHEVSHLFDYAENNNREPENRFILKRGAEQLGELLAEKLCRSLSPLTGISYYLEKNLASKFGKLLNEHFTDWIEKTNRTVEFKDMKKENLRQLLYAYVTEAFRFSDIYRCSFGEDEIDPEFDRLDWEEFNKAFTNLGRDCGCVYKELENVSEIGLAQLYFSVMHDLLNAISQVSASKEQNLKDQNKNRAEDLVSLLVNIINAADKSTSSSYVNEIKYDKDKNVLYMTKQFIEDLAAEILANGFSTLSEACPYIWQLAIEQEDRKLLYSLCDLYMGYTAMDSGTKFDAIIEICKAYKIPTEYKMTCIAELQSIEEQCEEYRTLASMHKRRSVLRLSYPQQNNDIIEQMVKAAIETAEEASGNWKYCNKNQQQLINRLTLKDDVQESLKRIVEQYGTIQLAEIWYQYTPVHREICADLGMCAFFDFSSFGYLVFMANLFIEHLHNEDLPIDEIEYHPGSSYDFRNRRYLEVIRVLSSTGEDLISDTQNMLIQLSNKIETGLLKDIQGKWGNVSTVYQQSEKLKQFVEKIIENLKNPLNESGIYDYANEIMHLINKIGQFMREYQREGKNTGTPPLDSDVVFCSINVLSDYLRYTRVIRQVCKFLMDAKQVIKDKSKDSAEFWSYTKYYHDIMDDKTGWICEKKNMPMFKNIGNFYNKCGVKFNTSYPFTEQVDFVFTYYVRAHKYYQKVYDEMEKNSAEKESVGMNQEKLHEYAENWFKLLGEKEVYAE